jgi:excisionase family DNA binding protein
MEQNILRAKEAARQLTVSMGTFWKLTKAGKLKTVKVSEKRLGVYQSEVDAYLARLNDGYGQDVEDCMTRMGGGKK